MKNITRIEIKKLFNELTIEEQNRLLIEHELQEKYYKKLKSRCQRSEKINSVHIVQVKVFINEESKEAFKCISVNKWYYETTGTPLYDIKLKNKWQSYLTLMKQGLSIKKIAKELEISI